MYFWTLILPHYQTNIKNVIRLTFYSDDPDYGENLYWSWSSDPNFKVKVVVVNYYQKEGITNLRVKY